MPSARFKRRVEREVVLRAAFVTAARFKSVLAFALAFCACANGQDVSDSPERRLQKCAYASDKSACLKALSIVETNSCNADDYMCSGDLAKKNLYEGICAKAANEFSCLTELMPAQGLISSDYFTKVFENDLQRAESCASADYTANFFNALATMKQTGRFLDGALAEYLVESVESLCINRQECLINAFETANEAARNIVLEQFQYIPMYYEAEIETVRACGELLRLTANKIQADAAGQK